MPRGWFRRRTPTLSVVVPVYNVADYLLASLDSVLAQGVPGVELVVVDDGSTDGSAELARAYAASHREVTLLEQPNSGVSIARNRALEACTGEFLTFVDPDDVLPQGAWASMLATLRRTGSDFVVGSACRLRTTADGERRMVPPLMERNHRQERLGIRIEDQPLMLADVFVWNKIFRRSWWERAAIRFPERTRYQDQVALTEAFLAADAFDVLTEIVYEWRFRPDLSSATQKRGQLTNLRERVTTKQMTLDRVRAHGGAELLATLLHEILPIDMWEHFRAAVAPTTPEPEEYWQVLREGMLAIWPPEQPFWSTAVPVQQRLMGWLVAQDRRDDLARLVALIDGPGLTRDGDRLLHPWVDDPALPAELQPGVRPA